MNETTKQEKKRRISYDRWGYFFIAPFFIVFIIFSLIPLLTTISSSFFENYRVGLKQIGPNFVFLKNYTEVIFNSELPRYATNTLIMWILGFVPQIVVSLILSILFTDTELRLKCSQFFKTVIYMPNLIMASAFAMLFFMLFSDSGPVNSVVAAIVSSPANPSPKPIRFLFRQDTVRSLIALMNFLMWYGNTTLLLMSGIMGINTSIFEAARIDGASPVQVFFRITLPSLKPILVYVIITSLIGGIQMFDVPQILTAGEGNPDRTSMTMIMYLNKHLYNKNYGLAGAVSVMIFIVTAALSGFVYKNSMKSYKSSTGSNK